MTWQTIVRISVMMSVVLICLYLLIFGDASIATIWTVRVSVAACIVGFLSLMNIPSVFGFFHRWTYAKAWMFPLLDGVWDVEVNSNWPRIQKTYLAAKNGGPKFDALIDALTVVEEEERITCATATIKSSLFSIELVLKPEAAVRESRTLFIKPFKDSSGHAHLTYVYKQEDTASVATTDSKEHFGAGVVRYIPETNEIRGNYWSDRREDAGLNTAGTIRMIRRQPVS